MIVSNLTNKVYIVFEEEDAITGTVYTIYPEVGTPIHGEIEDNSISISLKDGRYKIVVNNETEKDFEACFKVYYNGLPQVINDLKKVLCPCKGCGEEDKTLLSISFFNVLAFYAKAGLTSNSYAFGKLLELKSEVIQDKKEYEKYYGVFKFDYTKVTEEILSVAYIELYLLATTSLSDEDNLDAINKLFDIKNVESCLYAAGINIPDVICEIQNYTCHVC